MYNSHFRTARILCLALALLCILSSCSVPHAAGEPSPSKSVAESPTVEMELTITPLAQSPAVSSLIMPEASGTVVYENEFAKIDASHTDLGYIMICHTAYSDKRMKVIITGPSLTAYTYNLPSNDEFAVFPLSDSSGSYSVKIYENAYDDKYALILDAKLDVKLKDEFAPFLTPNQFVNYNENTEAVLVARQLTAGQTDPIKKIEIVFKYVVNFLSYDYELARTVQSGYLPDLDEVLIQKKGICFDYASLMTAMLRSLNIPTKLVVGYTGSIYHAWISTYTDESGWVDGVIFFDGAKWKLMDPTFVSAAEKDDMVDYMENDANYQAKYLY